MGRETINVNEPQYQQQGRQENVRQEQSRSRRAIFLSILVPVLVFLLFVLIGIGLKATSKQPEIKKRSRPILAVMVTKAFSDTVQLSVNVQGQSRPRTEIDLVPEVSGKIVSVSPKFISGGLFNKGDVLYRIDPADYNVAVVRAAASVARAQQVLVREESEGAIAKMDWDDLGNGQQASALTLRKPQLLEAQAELRAVEADLENAKIRLRRTAVTAPFNGQVRETFAGIGQYVNSGFRLGRIFSTDIAEVKLALSDADIARINLPLAFVAKNRVSAPYVKLSATIGGKLREWDGKIMRTNPAYDPQTRSMFAIAEVVDPYGKGASGGKGTADRAFPLAPGLFVDADIAGKIIENAIIIPRDALRPEDKVYTVNQEGIAKSHDVIVVDTNPDRAVLLSGLEPGELVIVSPLQKSQISLTFRVLDRNDPTKILIEPKKDEKDEEQDKGHVDLVAAKQKMINSKQEYKKTKKEYVAAKKKYSKDKKNRKGKDRKNYDKNDIDKKTVDKESTEVN